MSDLGTMENRVSDELNRTDMTAYARTAIQTAIKHYEGTRFWFNEGRSTASTVADQEWYDMPSDFREIDSLKITINDNDYVLNERHYSEIENWAITPSAYTGYPTDYCIYNDQLRLYPAPNDVYTLSISYWKDLTDIATATDSNAWMVEAEELIRSRVEADLCFRVIRDFERAQGFKTLETEALNRLLAETGRRTTTGYSKRRSI